MGTEGPLVGVLALQGAFEEHQKCLEAVGCRTVQVRTQKDLDNLDGIVLPGGESTAMGLIGTNTTVGESKKTMWQCLQDFSKEKPTWGTCAGMILLAEKCVGTSAVIQDGQALIGGVDITVCRNYFGSQVSSFEMNTPPPPNASDQSNPFPGIFIRAPAILWAGPGVKVLGTVVATPCSQAAVTLHELHKKIEKGENVVKLGVVDALDRDEAGIHYKVVVDTATEEEKKDSTSGESIVIRLPGAAGGSTARKVICAVKKDNLLCTAFHPELTGDHRWHEYFVQQMVVPRTLSKLNKLESI